MFQESIAVFALVVGLTAGAQRPVYTVAPAAPVHYFMFVAHERVVPQRPLQGRVVTTQGKPLVHAAVSLIVDGTNEVISTTHTDGEGNYKLNVPPEGKYCVRVRSLGFTPVTIPVSSDDASKVAVADVTLHPFDTHASVAAAEP